MIEDCHTSQKFNQHTFSSLSLSRCLNLRLRHTDRVHILADRSLKIDNITMEDIGEYSCEAENAAGAIVASGTLLVHCKFFKFLKIYRKF